MTEQKRHNTNPTHVGILCCSLVLVLMSLSCRKLAVQDPNSHRFVVQLVGDFPAKFHNQRVGVRAEGIFVKEMRSREPLQQLEFMMDRAFIDRAVADKVGADADRLEVSIRLEPLDQPGRETEFVVTFNIELEQPMYEVMLGANLTPDDNPIKSEDTDQSSKIN